MNRSILLPAFCIIFLFASIASQGQKVSTKDSLILVELYKTTNGPNWHINYNWLTKAPLGTWYGVAVNSGRVTGLTLNFNNLQGGIPASLGKLDKLYQLYLDHNYFTGNIPTELGNLANLSILSLSFCHLSGRVPVFPSRLASLSIFDISNNFFNYDGMEVFAQSFPTALYAPQISIYTTSGEDKGHYYARFGGMVGYNTYKWYRNGILVATKTGDSTYVPAAPGKYTVVVTNSIATALSFTSGMPAVFIGSVSPLSGTYHTKITITGFGFTKVDPGYIRIGGARCDSGVIASDSKMVAWAGSGNSGSVTADDGFFSGFTYTPASIPSDSGWIITGPVKATAKPAYCFGGVTGTDNLPIIGYQDAVTRKAMAVKLTVNNTFKILGGTVSDGIVGQAQIIIDKTNSPIIAYVDSTNKGYLTAKKLVGNTWTVLGKAGFAPGSGFSMAIDQLNNVYVACNTGNLPYYPLTVYKFNGTSWAVLGAPGFAKSAYGFYNIAVDKISGMPYIVFDDYTHLSSSYGPEATVMKYDGNSWVTVGAPGFTSSKYGVYYADIAVDPSGNPVVAFQEDNGFERVSAYKYTGGAWKQLGAPYFSKGHCYNVNLALSRSGVPFVTFWDASYNNRSSVMQFNGATNVWEFAGARGLFNTSYMGRNAVFSDNNNTMWAAFSNQNQGGSISLMKYTKAVTGKTEDSKAIKISADDEPARLLGSPNPFRDKTTIAFKSSREGTYLLEIRDAQGRQIKTASGMAKQGKNEITISLTSLASGTYYVTVIINNRQQTLKLVKQ